MHINRRTAIRQFLFVTAGVAVLPACFQDDEGKSSALLRNFRLTGAQEKMLQELTDTIIPETGTPGAKAVYAHLFVLKMMDDCFNKNDQQQFVKGLEAFDKAAQQQFNQPFAKCSKTQRETMVKDINGNAGKDAALSFFYNTSKWLTIEAYTSSQYFLTKVQVYKMLPGKFNGCVPVKTNATTTV